MIRVRSACRRFEVLVPHDAKNLRERVAGLTATDFALAIRRH